MLTLDHLCPHRGALRCKSCPPLSLRHSSRNRLTLGQIERPGPEGDFFGIHAKKVRPRRSRLRGWATPWTGPRADAIPTFATTVVVSLVNNSPTDGIMKKMNGNRCRVRASMF